MKMTDFEKAIESLNGIKETLEESRALVIKLRHELVVAEARAANDRQVHREVRSPTGPWFGIGGNTYVRPSDASDL